MRYISMVILSLLMSCAIADEPSESSAPAVETKRLNAWLDAEFSEYLDFSPLAKTRQGDKSDYGELDDVSMAASDRVTAWRRQSVEKMQTSFDRSKLDQEGKISWDLWEFMLQQAEAAEPYKWHRYIFGRSGPHTGLPNGLINYHKVDSAADMDAYISRLNQSGRYLGQYLVRVKTSAERGIRAPYFDYELALNQIEQLMLGVPFSEDGESAIWIDITTKIRNLESQLQIDRTQAAAFESAARTALLNVTKPSYDEIAGWLRADLKNVPAEALGASALPDGKAYYDYALGAMTTLALTAESIHQTGHQEVARIQAEMMLVKDQLGFKGNLQEFFVFMREGSQFYFSNTDEGRRAYLEMARDYLGKMQERLPDYFGILPKAPLEVQRVEPFREQAGGAAHYARGTSDGSRPGRFYIHMADMKAVAKYRLENLAYHEGLPGHHLQISIQQELDNIPRFRTYHGYTAFSEGWGLYAELLAKEMGFYNDPYNDFGRLTGEIWRAIRLVVDTGIHAKGWSEDEAVTYALLNSSRPEAAVRAEIRRYFNNPAQATAYKIGMLEILALRAQVKQALGDDFDYRSFHDALLGSGPLPMPLLAKKLAEWTDSVKARRIAP